MVREVKEVLVSPGVNTKKIRARQTKKMEEGGKKKQEYARMRVTKSQELRAGIFFVLFFRDRVCPGCSGTHFVDQAGLKLRNPPAFAFVSRVLGLKVCATTPGALTRIF